MTDYVYLKCDIMAVLKHIRVFQRKTTACTHHLHHLCFIGRCPDQPLLSSSNYSETKPLQITDTGLLQVRSPSCHPMASKHSPHLLASSSFHPPLNYIKEARWTLCTGSPTPITCWTPCYCTETYICTIRHSAGSANCLNVLLLHQNFHAYAWDHTTTWSIVTWTI